MLYCLFITLALATEPAPDPPQLEDSGAEPAFVLPEDPLQAAREAYAKWDLDRARTILEAYLDSPENYRQRTATRLLLGRTYMELGEYGLASAQFYRVRLGEGGDAKVAAWYEILVDLERGRPHVAIRECEQYRERFGAGRRASECMVVIGDAEARRGHLLSARNAYDAYLNVPEHADHMREEEMSLRLALATAQHNPERAIPKLVHLALHHSFAATGAAAETALNQLADAGYDSAIVPSDSASRMAHTDSLRRSGWADEAWSAFKTLEHEQPDNPDVVEWVAQQARRYERSTRHPIASIRANIERYEGGEKTGSLAWEIFQGWRLAGRWDRAAAWGRIGLRDHASKWPWRGRTDDVAHAVMLSGDFKAAADAWAVALKERHGSRQEAAFYEALTAMLAGQHDRAHSKFSALIDQGGSLALASRYWRIRTAERAGRTDTLTDRTRIEADDSVGWYALLLSDSTPSGEGWVTRDGTWREGANSLEPTTPRTTIMDPAGRNTPPVILEEVTQEPPASVDAGTIAEHEDEPSPMPPPPAGAWSFIESHGLSSPKPRDLHIEDFPSGVTASAHYDPEKALATLRRLGTAHHEIWPDLKDAHHLAQAGLTDESGPIVRAAYAEFRDPSSVSDPARRTKIEALTIKKSDWVAAAIVAGDRYFQVKHLWKQTTDVDPEAFTKLQFPIAYGRELWPHCQRWNLDPYLVLAIMRQESIYNPEALSHTGAIGLMQIIKGTGAKISALLGEPFFAPVTLYNPSVNLRYAVYYMNLLNQRFNGNFAMAVASYNGGPHHMSRAHRQTLGTLDLDAFVEMIPRKEPRDYVKKVVGYYAQYVDLYGPPGARVVLPKRLTADIPEIVNF